MGYIEYPEGVQIKMSLDDALKARENADRLKKLEKEFWSILDSEDKRYLYEEKALIEKIKQKLESKALTDEAVKFCSDNINLLKQNIKSRERKDRSDKLQKRIDKLTKYKVYVGDILKEIKAKHFDKADEMIKKREECFDQLSSLGCMVKKLELVLPEKAYNELDGLLKDAQRHPSKTKLRKINEKLDKLLIKHKCEIFTHLYNRAWEYINDGKPKEALHIIDDEILKIKLSKSNLAQAYDIKGYVLYLLENNEESIIWFDKALKMDTRELDKAFTYNIQGKNYYILGYNDKALEYWDKSLKLNKDGPMIWLNKGHLCYRSGEYKKASKCYEKAMKAEDETIKAYAAYCKGSSLFELGKYGEAEFQFAIANSLVQSVDANFMLWKIYHIKKETKCAHEHLDKALKLIKEGHKPIDIKITDVYRPKIKMQYEAGDYKAAFQTALEIRKFDENFYYDELIFSWVNYLLYRLHSKIEVFTLLEKNFSDENEKEPSLLLNMGLYSEDDEDKLEYYDEGIRLTSDSNLLLVMCWYNKGQALKRLGRKKEALHCYKKVILFDYGLDEKFDMFFIDNYDSIVTNDSVFGVKWLALSNELEILQELKKYDEIVNFIDNIPEIYEERYLPLLLIHKGDAYDKMEQLGDALKCYNAALDGHFNKKYSKSLNEYYGQNVMPKEETVRILQKKIEEIEGSPKYKTGILLEEIAELEEKKNGLIAAYTDGEFKNGIVAKEYLKTLTNLKTKINKCRADLEKINNR